MPIPGSTRAPGTPPTVALLLHSYALLTVYREDPTCLVIRLLPAANLSVVPRSVLAG